MRGDHHPRCDLLLRSLCFDQIVFDLSLLQSPRRQTARFLWTCFQFLLIPLHFFTFFQAVVHVVLDMIVVERVVIFIFTHCAEYRTSTMPSTSFVFAVSTLSFIMLPVHILSTSSAFASALSQFAPAAAAFSFSACAFASSLSACAAVFLWRRFSFYYYFSMISWYLFSSSSFSTSMFFLFGSHLSCFIMSCFPLVFLQMVILSKRGDRESRHDTSVVTSHVDHVVGFGVFVVSQVSSLG